MKKLYLTDLDGTLLNSDAVLSEYTKRNLNLLAKQGVLFSAATARTAATVNGILKGVETSIPVILMNGVCIYDLQKKKYLEVNVISDDSKRQLYDAVSGTSGFLYTIDNNQLSTFYECSKTEHSRAFRTEREKKYGKVFTHVKNFHECDSLSAVYFSVAGEYEELSALFTVLSSIDGIRTEFYRDVYHTNFWYLEVCSKEASKYRAALSLKKQFHIDRLIGFGDNLNDLPLFEACDECYAVSNAKPEIRERANGVIGSNIDDAVVKFILEQEGILPC